MVIKASSAGEIRRLVDALGSGDEVRREAAIARLAIIGARAVDRLLAAYRAAGERDTRIAILRALESTGDGRTAAVAREALSTGGDEAIAAAAALRGLLDSPHGPTAADALDALVATALDTTAERRLRLAAWDALQDMPPGVRDRVAATLQADPDAGIRAGAELRQRGAAAGRRADADAIWADALEGDLPDDPAVLREILQPRAAAAALSSLLKLIDVVRGREQATRAAAKRGAWQALRGTLHQALALRGSRLAVYDLRETLEAAADPLPASFLAALHVVGDASCLVPLAEAHARAVVDSPWRQQLAAAFQAIAKRERVTKRHAVMKRIASRWPEIIGTR
jgi:hypothetical protein